MVKTFTLLDVSSIFLHATSQRGAGSDTPMRNIEASPPPHFLLMSSCLHVLLMPACPPFPAPLFRSSPHVIRSSSSCFHVFMSSCLHAIMSSCLDVFMPCTPHVLLTSSCVRPSFGSHPKRVLILRLQEGEAVPYLRRWVGSALFGRGWASPYLGRGRAKSPAPILTVPTIPTILIIRTILYLLSA